MAKHKHIPFVVLGAHDKPNKGMIAYKMPDSNMYNLTFVELENDGRYDFGDMIDVDKIKGVYQSILFCDVRSVDAVIRELQKIKALMVNDNLPEQVKNAVQDLMAFKERYKDGESTKRAR
jgi:hypothetical protein